MPVVYLQALAITAGGALLILPLSAAAVAAYCAAVAFVSLACVHLLSQPSFTHHQVLMRHEMRRDAVAVGALTGW